jgi:hypothetical protein
MKRTNVLMAMLFATLLPAGAARAEVSCPVTGYESITYRPRYDRPRRYRDESRSSGGSSTVSQLHVGFFSPSEFSSSGLLLGFRGGVAPDEHVQIGVDVDWHYKSENQTDVVSQQTLPTGGSSQVKRVLSRASSNLIPVLGYLQVSGDHTMPIIPYAGAGVGYEAYFLSAADFNTGAHFDAEFGGFAWQAWAGAQVPLSGRSRLVGEVFMNQADLGRDVDILGVAYRESVNLNGAGMRFGVNWGF